MVKEMINNSRAVENAYSMMKYLYSELANRRFKNMDITICQNLDDLYALIISTWSASLAKEGLYKEYVTIEGEEMTSPKGQVDLQESIIRQSQTRGSLVCNYDELSDNIYINKVLKGTMQYLLYQPEISDEVKLNIQKSLIAFNGVERTDIELMNWKNVSFNNNNMRYKHLIEVCKTYFNEKSLAKTVGLDDGIRLYILFKKQIEKFLGQRYGGLLDVTTFEMPFTLENEPPFELYINKVQRMTVLSSDDRSLIYLIRLQDELAMNDNKIRRKRLDEMVGYMREYMARTGTKASGVIVYVNTDRNKLNFEPMTVNIVENFPIGETIVDIFDQWRFIENKLNDPYKYFIERFNKGSNHKIIKRQ